jgi:dihydrofolate reductase
MLPMRRQIAIIAAVARNGVIGANGRVPWKLPEDLKRFKTLTSGHTVIMGSRTWDSIGAALPNRQNIVVSRSIGATFAGAEQASSLAEAYVLVRLPEPVFVIGGGHFYREALQIASRVYLTEIHKEFAGDVSFPALCPGLWIEYSRDHRKQDGEDGFAYDFVEYRRAAT